MKKAKLFLSLLVVMTVICSVFMLSSTVSSASDSNSVATAESNAPLGDVNGDGLVNGKDVVRLARYMALADTEDAATVISPSADINGDGTVDQTDMDILTNSLTNHYETDTETEVVNFGYTVVNDSFFYFGNDGLIERNSDRDGHHFDRNGRLEGDQEFVTVESETYYLRDNVITYNYQVINGNIYYLGDEGARLEGGEHEGHSFDEHGVLNAPDGFLSIGEDIYHLIDNLVSLDYQLVDDSLYYFGNDGVMRRGEEHGGHRFGHDGRLEADSEFVTVGGDTYYLQGNVIVYNYQVINGNIYYFGTDGVRVENGRDGDNVFGSDGRLVANNSFVTAGGNTYYLQNNVIVVNYQIINGNIYYFGSDGVMQRDGEHDGHRFGSDGRLEGNDEFVSAGGNTYYLQNNTIVYNYQIINGNIYYFGNDGVMREGEVDGNNFGSDGRLEADDSFVSVDGNTYYVQDNTVLLNYQIINGNIYYFGDDGVRTENTTHGGNSFDSEGRLEADEEFVSAGENTYYVRDNVIVYNYQIINGNIYYFGDDGVRTENTTHEGNHYGSDGRLEADNEFVSAGGNTYYVQNNVIVYNYQIINGNIYYFGNDGAMRRDETVGGNRFGSDGRLEADDQFVNAGGNTYYVRDNVIVYNYQIINGNIYYFGDDGVRTENATHGGHHYDSNGRLNASNSFVSVSGNTYYLVNNVIVYNYQIINGNIYYFGNDGVRVENGDHDGNHFGDDGKMETSEPTVVEIDGIKYMVIGEDSYRAYTLTGTVYASDTDLDSSNNPKLSGVMATVTAYGHTFECTTDANGVFDFGYLPKGAAGFTLSYSGYNSYTDSNALNGNRQVTVTLDKSISNSLTGKVTVADGDTNYSNNAVLSGATLTLKKLTGTASLVKTATTGSAGTYTFSGLTEGVYELTVTCDKYITATQQVVVRANETTVQNAVIEMVLDVEKDGYASGYISDARTGSYVSGLTIYIREGIGNTTGTVLTTLTTSSSGYYYTGALAPGNYTAEIVDNRSLSSESYRYATATFTVKVVSDTTVTNQNMTVSNSVGIVTGSIRIVLTWGSTPRDLDSHLTTPGGEVYYSNKNNSYANLDVDDTSGYGPETTTIKSSSGRYHFYVYNYTGSPNICYSGAKVTIYSGNQVLYTFNVPSSGSGRYWHVFTYDASTGEFVIQNKITSSSSSY